jgi:hypothetical protein
MNQRVLRNTLISPAAKRHAYNLIDYAHSFSPRKTKLTKRIGRPRIGMAVLCHERPDFLRVCLDTLFQTELKDYEITFLLHDDGSQDPEVRRIIDTPRAKCYNIVRRYKDKGHNSWGAAFNSAVRDLLDLDDFNIVGTCDSDALFHPQWLDITMKVALWAKEHHRGHILGPFSSFNSSDYRFHKHLGYYKSPFGDYVVKRRMGAVNYFYFTEDLHTLGFFEESKDDETLMTRRFHSMRVRSFSLVQSYVEHIGSESVLDQWRPSEVGIDCVYGLNLPPHGWPKQLAECATEGFCQFVQPFSENCSKPL